MSATAPLRVVRWAAGGVGAIAVRAIARRPDLELVGVYQNLQSPSSSIVVLREKANGKRYKLRVGDQVGRARLGLIRPRDAVFTIQDFGYERQETLSLRKQEVETP